MLIALTREPSPSLSACVLTFVERQTINPDLALRQHRDYCEMLRAHGVEVITLPADPALPDSVFVEDAAVVLDELAVVASMGVASRRAETAGIEKELARFRPVERIFPPATLEGGDVLRVGKKLFVGLSPRTNAAGVESLRALAAPHGYEIIPVTLRDCLHLQTACTALDDRTLLMNPAWVDRQPFAAFEVVATPEDEPWAANALRLGEVVCVNAAFPRTAAAVAGRGYAVRRVDVSEFMKAEAGLTCLSLIFSREM